MVLVGVFLEDDESIVFLFFFSREEEARGEDEAQPPISSLKTKQKKHTKKIKNEIDNNKVNDK
jgi:hypothetical protein